MGYAVVFSKEAKKQIHQLQNYLSLRFYPANVERYIERLVDACESLGDAPHRGARRDELRPNVRVVGFERKAAIYFKLVEDRVMILGVLYGGQRFESEE